MKTYNNPEIEILLFDEEEIVMNSTVNPQPEQAVTAAYQINEYFFEKGNADSTTTIKLQDITVQ